MNTEHPRIKREKKTIEAMIRIYCKSHHEKEGKGAKFAIQFPAS